LKALIIQNPSAGQRSMNDEIRQIVGLLKGQGWDDIGVRQTRGPGDATTYAREAAAEGYDAVFVAGGDGTLAQVIDGLVGAETAMAILPTGTGNIMARQLNLPIPGPLLPGGALLEAARLALQGQVRRVDVGRMSFPQSGAPARHFICWAGVGFDAEFNLQFNRDRDFKRRMSAGAMAVAAYFTVRDFAGTGAVVRVDGERVSRRLLMLSASNIQIYGIVFKMAPDARLDDGLLDIVCFQGSHPVRMVAHLGEMLFNQHMRNPQVDIFQARRVEVSTTRPLRVHVDGDCIGETPVVIEVVPRSLNLMVPNSASPDLFTDQTGMAAAENRFDWMRRVARDAGNAIKERSHLP
jgi:YegS/Rv2252/BmrU family lipid kinase